MSNNENLIPFNERTEEEVRAIAKKGGIKSGESRRQKKALRECLEILLAEEYEIDTTGMCDYKTMSGAMAISYKLIQEALKGNIRAFLAIRDTIGETVTTKVSVTNDISQSVIDEVERIVMCED